MDVNWSDHLDFEANSVGTPKEAAEKLAPRRMTQPITGGWPVQAPLGRGFSAGRCNLTVGRIPARSYAQVSRKAASATVSL